MQASLGAAGFKVKLVPATQSDFYGKYLENPATSKRDVWDIAPPGWVPDWFGNNGRSTIVPLLTQPGPGSNDFGGYTSPTVNSDVAKALAAPSLATATKWWQAANEFAMKDAAIIPLFDLKWAVYHSSAVHNCSFWWPDLNCDPANVWLSNERDTVADRTGSARERIGSRARPVRGVELQRPVLRPSGGVMAEGWGALPSPPVAVAPPPDDPATAAGRAARGARQRRPGARSPPGGRRCATTTWSTRSGRAATTCT